MSLSNNRINTTIAPADMTAIRNALTAIETAFQTYSRPLTVEERIALPKMGVANKGFTEDAITAANNNPSFFPAYFVTTDMVADITIYSQLEELIQRVAQLLEVLRDTQMLAGSEAYVSGLAVYRLFEAAAKAGQPGADVIYAMLKERFAGQGGSGEPTPPTA